MSWGKCKLCHETRLLIKSHIVPKFMYDGLLDGLNRTLFIEMKDFSKGKFVQAGISEKGLLCKKCDNEILGRLEKYAASVLYSGKGTGQLIISPHISHDGVKNIRLNNLDYTKFKLFILSILWRAHHSKHRLFSKINVDEHENILRKMLLNENAGEESNYKIGIISLRDASGDAIRIMPDPEARRTIDSWFAGFFINGFVYFIDLDRERGFALMKDHYLQSKGELTIPIVEGFLARQFLSAFGLPNQVVNAFFPAKF